MKKLLFVAAAVGALAAPAMAPASPSAKVTGITTATATAIAIAIVRSSGSMNPASERPLSRRSMATAPKAKPSSITTTTDPATRAPSSRKRAGLIPEIADIARAFFDTRFDA